jgi:hypothetical protein
VTGPRIDRWHTARDRDGAVADRELMHRATTANSKAREGSEADRHASSDDRGASADDRDLSLLERTQAQMDREDFA